MEKNRRNGDSIDIEKAWAEKLEVLADITERMRIVLANSETDDDCWSIKLVARNLSCSERTVRRRIRDDPTFPAPSPATSYNDKGRIRKTQPRWNAIDIKRYKASGSSTHS